MGPSKRHAAVGVHMRRLTLLDQPDPAVLCT